MKGMIIPVGSLQSNCYLVYDEETNKGFIIDPGDEAQKIIETIKESGAQIEYIILTHTHFDHVGAVDEVKRFTAAKVLVHKDELFIKPEWEAEFVEDLQKLKVGNLELNFLHTPGHTKGGICIICDDALFCGDTMFKEECGRCDLEGGDYGEMLKSLNSLSKLSGNYNVYPGHGEPSDLEHERKHNPYMRESYEINA